MLQLIKALPRATAASVQFLSRLPLWRVMRLDAMPDFRRTAHAFPLAGLLLGALTWLPAGAILWMGAPAELCGFALVATGVLLTGALHEDGLADVADGIWGGATVERKLAIMRDSTVGTYGVLALVGIVLLRWLLWAIIFTIAEPWHTLAIAAAAASLSRAAMLLPWALLPAARPADSTAGGVGKEESGLSARYGAPDRTTLLAGAAMCAPALLLLGLSAPAVLIGLAIGTATVAVLARHHVQGHTGDVLGATQQLAEAGLLSALVLAIGAA